MIAAATATAVQILSLNINIKKQQEQHHALLLADSLVLTHSLTASAEQSTVQRGEGAAADGRMKLRMVRDEMSR